MDKIKLYKGQIIVVSAHFGGKKRSHNPKQNLLLYTIIYRMSIALLVTVHI